MREPRSAFGQPPDQLKAILAPLRAKLEELINRPLIRGPRREFLYFQLFDALRTGKAIETLIWAEAQSLGVSADSVEVLVRRVVEQAIVASYVAKAPDAAKVVNRYLKTSALEWERSFGQEAPEEAPEEALREKALPPYSQMAEQVGGWLLEDFKKLSYVSHPRGAIPYRLIERNSSISEHEFFVIRVSSSLDPLKTAVTFLVDAFEKVDSADD